MKPTTKAILKAALINGLVWTFILVALTYFFKGGIFGQYIPLWFLFFASTGAYRKYLSFKSQ